MNFLPVVERELRVLARRPTTTWLRFYAALGIVLVWLLLLTGARNTAPAELAQRLFIAFGVLALGFCLLAGIFLTADCLSEEKREGTLGLLFLTDLRGYDVVLGKLIATSVQSVYGLMAVFPILALPLMMGGVGAGEFWRMVLVLLVTLLLSLGLGMLSSALNRDARQAMGAAFLAMLVLAGVLPVCWWLITILSGRSASSTLLLPSPVQAFRAAFDFCYRTRSGAHEFWLSLDILAALGLGSLVFAAVVLPRAWQERSSLLAARKPTEKTTGAAVCDEHLRQLGSMSLREHAPFCWLGSRDHSTTRLARLIMSPLFIVWTCFLLVAVSSSKYQVAFVVCLFLGYGLHQVFKYLAALEATRQVNEDSRSGALELLLVTPLRERDIIAGHARAFRRRFVPLAVLVGAVNLLLSLALFAEPLHMGRVDTAIFLELFIGGLILLPLDFKAIETIGFCSALRAKRHSRAILATLGRVMGVPWAAVFLLVFLMMGFRGSPDTAAVVFALWFVIGILTDVVIIVRAGETLRRGLRYCLTEETKIRP
jgi:ABC-type transport system involved in multi-copper enzyme maturation permease subunit